jgi:transposase
MRDGMVSARTQHINMVRGWLRQQLQSLRCTPETFPKNVRLALENSPTGLPDYLEGPLKIIEALNEQIAEATRQIEAMCKRDAICRNLQTVPGVGPMTAMAFVAVIDDVTRFGEAMSVSSYLGLTPGERSSSGKIRRTGITKAGPAILRQYLTQAALTLRRLRPEDPMCQWAERIKQRRGKQVAIVALTRKLSGILYAMWRDNAAYQPSRGAKIAGEQAMSS